MKNKHLPRRRAYKVSSQLFAILLLSLVSISITAQIKVMSYNIHYGVGVDNKNSIKDIAELINKENPDIVGLQEIGDSIMAAKFGELTGMKVVFGPSLDNSMTGYGDAILSKYSFEWEGNVSIPSASSSRYQAMSVKVDFSEKSKDMGVVRLINTHFDWLTTIGSEYARLATVDVIEEAFLKDGPTIPTLLTGDFNAEPDSKVVAKLKKYKWLNSSEGGTHYTIESVNPTMQIDYIFYKPSKKLKLQNFYVINGILSSDHLPIIAEFIYKK